MKFYLSFVGGVVAGFFALSLSFYIFPAVDGQPMWWHFLLFVMASAIGGIVMDIIYEKLGKLMNNGR